MWIYSCSLASGKAGFLLLLLRTKFGLVSLASYLVSKVKSCSENNNTMLAKPSICDKPEVVFIL